MNDEQGNNLLTAHGAKLLSKKAIDADLENKKNLVLTEDETKLMTRALNKVRTEAESGFYRALFVVGEGTNPPAEVVAQVNNVKSKLEGLGYEVEVRQPQNAVPGTRPYLGLNISWKKD